MEPVTTAFRHATGTPVLCGHDDDGSRYIATDHTRFDKGKIILNQSLSTAEPLIRNFNGSGASVRNAGCDSGADRQ